MWMPVEFRRACSPAPQHGSVRTSDAPFSRACCGSERRACARRACLGAAARRRGGAEARHVEPPHGHSYITYRLSLNIWLGQLCQQQCAVTCKRVREIEREKKLSGV